MPTGSKATFVANDPRTMGVAFVADPAAFFALTQRKQWVPIAQALPGPGLAARATLPASGVISHLKVMFVGTVTATVDATTRSRWPYGFLERLYLVPNGQHNLYSVAGEKLVALRVAKYPNGWHQNDDLDVIPGGDGAGQTVTAVGSPNDMVLTWDVPVAIDDGNLIGSLYAQSTTMNIELLLQQAATDDIIDAGAGAVTFDGTFYVEVTTYGVPHGAAGVDNRLITPDTSRLHAVQQKNTPITAAGETRAYLTRVQGQVDRLLVSAFEADPAGSTTDEYLYADADPGGANDLDGIRIEYGADVRPYSFVPAAFLAQQNLEDYGERLPYGNLAFDFLVENPIRDVVNMPSLTEAAVVLDVGTGATVAAGARAEVVQESLFI